MRKLLAITASFLLLGAPGYALQDVPAAVLVQVEGAVQVQIAGGSPQDAAVGGRLSVGDQVLPGQSGRAVLVYRTGATQVVTEAITIEAATVGAEVDMFSRTVQVLAQAATSDARSQPNRQGMIRPIPGEPVLIGPRNEITVMDSRPTFSWHSVPEAAGYTIQIRKDGSRPVRYQTGPDTTWTLPMTSPALTHGDTYWWTVAPAASGRATREGRFQVIDVEEYQGVVNSIQAISDAGLDPTGDGAFLAVVIYRDAGLLYDAAGLLSFLEDSGATLSRDVLLLQGEIMDALGQLDAARKAFDKADEMMR